MTAPDTRPICQWCRRPVTGTPTWWDEEPQCPNLVECDQRIKEQR